MKIESLRRGSFGNAHKMIFPPRIFTNIVAPLIGVRKTLMLPTSVDSEMIKRKHQKMSYCFTLLKTYRDAKFVWQDTQVGAIGSVIFYKD